MTLLYRIGQFWRIATDGPLPETRVAEIRPVLGSAEMELFRSLPDNEQWHGYRVFDTLRSAGHDQPELLAAALLHDAGKARIALSVWDRTAIVLAHALVPRLSQSWGKGQPAGWRRPFVVKAQHPEWGAEMAETAGSAPATVSLIRRHQDSRPENAADLEDELLAHLQWADDLN